MRLARRVRSCCRSSAIRDHSRSFTITGSSFERTYQRLLGELSGEPTVWAERLFADPISDVAVLGPPDNQELYPRESPTHPGEGPAVRIRLPPPANPVPGGEDISVRRRRLLDMKRCQSHVADVHARYFGQS